MNINARSTLFAYRVMKFSIHPAHPMMPMRHATKVMATSVVVPLKRSGV